MNERKAERVGSASTLTRIVLKEAVLLTVLQNERLSTSNDFNRHNSDPSCAKYKKTRDSGAMIDKAKCLCYHTGISGYTSMIA